MNVPFNFRIYFLKKETRVYEKTDLITLLTSNPNISAPEDISRFPKIYKYKHQTLDFEANFVMSDRAVIPNIDRLPGNYYDVNFYVELSLISSEYAYELILDIIEEIVRKFKFYIHIQSVPELITFKRAQLISVFKSWKKAFVDKNPEYVSQYNKLDPQALSQVYGYLQKRKRLSLLMDGEEVNVSDYVFLHSEKSRTAYVAIKWDGNKAFILPPAVDLIILEDGKIIKYIQLSEIMKKAEKMFSSIDGYGEIKLLELKYVKKLHKVLLKEKFSPLSSKLEELTIDKILDI